VTIWFAGDKTQHKVETCVVCNHTNRYIFGIRQYVEVEGGSVCIPCINVFVNDYVVMVNPWDKKLWEEEE